MIDTMKSPADAAKFPAVATGAPADAVQSPSFAVCLAAFNGMEFLVEQVESILSQQGVLVQIFISVDPSTDGTEASLAAWARTEARLTVLPSAGRFGGAARNFFRLIRDVDFSGFDYLALADQDDIWMGDKLLAAHQRMLEGDFSAYSGNVTAFWPDGRRVLISKAQAQKRYDFLFQGGGAGCTYVLRAGEASDFKAFLTGHWAEVNGISMHDWFIYAWFRAENFAWTIDPEPKVLYRQHDGNLFGANSGVHGILNRFKRLRSGWYRGEIARTAGLLAARMPGLPPGLARDGSVPRLFCLRNLGEMRRRLPERLFLFFLVMSGLY